MRRGVNRIRKPGALARLDRGRRFVLPSVVALRGGAGPALQIDTGSGFAPLRRPALSFGLAGGPASAAEKIEG